MKIGVAQIRPFKGDIEENIEKHLHFINVSMSYKSDLIVFPELSLMGYEPELASKLGTTPDDHRLDVFQQLSDKNNVSICIGLPIRTTVGIQIGMVIFQPSRRRQLYAKQLLHPDEYPYFVKGEQSLVLNIKSKIIAPAICYESLLPEHAENAFSTGATMYLTSVAKPANGVAKAFKHYPEVARKYSMTVLMSNCVGPCDNMECVGQSSVWNKHGKLLGQLNDTGEGLLIFDAETEEIIEWTE